MCAEGKINEIYEWNGLGFDGTQLTNSKAKQTDSHQTVAKRFCISNCHSRSCKSQLKSNKPGPEFVLARSWVVTI